MSRKNKPNIIINKWGLHCNLNKIWGVEYATIIKEKYYWHSWGKYYTITSMVQAYCDFSKSGGIWRTSRVIYDDKHTGQHMEPFDFVQYLREKKLKRILNI